MTEKSKSLVLATAIDDEGTTSALMQGRTQLGETTETGLILYDPGSISYEEYVEIGRLLGNANRRLQWVIGDWLNMVEDIYPDRYSQAADATGLSPQTLTNRASICRHIPQSKRRAGVGFSVHAEVAYLEPDERDKWLERAYKEDWKRSELRAHRGKDNPPPRSRTCPECGHEF